MSAGKSVDLGPGKTVVSGFLVSPAGDTTHPYFLKRLWDYFVEHLMGEGPPRDFAIGGLRGVG